MDSSQERQVYRFLFFIAALLAVGYLVFGRRASAGHYERIAQPPEPLVT